MRYVPHVFFLALLVCASAVPASAEPDGWHASLKEGVEAAAKSNKPLLVITAWKRKL